MTFLEAKSRAGQGLSGLNGAKPAPWVSPHPEDKRAPSPKPLWPPSWKTPGKAPVPQTIAAPARPRSPRGAPARAGGRAPGMRPHCLPAALPGSHPRSNGAAPEVTSGALAGGPWASVSGRGQQERTGPCLLFGAQWPTQQDRGPLSPGNLPHSRLPVSPRKGGRLPRTTGSPQ